MNKIKLFIKVHLWQLTTFLLGTIVVILLTKVADDIFPGNPIIIKEVSDSLKIVHSYDIPNLSINDSIDLLLQQKLNKISQLNLYEKELDNYYKKIRNKEVATLDNIPNKIILDQNKKPLAKGYTQEAATAFFESECPSIKENQKYIDFNFNFITPEIISDIYCLRLFIYKKINGKFNYSYFDEIYEVRLANNFIRINNDLPKGEYKYQYGIMLKKDINKEYPEVYSKSCYVNFN